MSGVKGLMFGVRRTMFKSKRFALGVESLISGQMVRVKFRKFVSGVRGSCLVKKANDN